MRNPAATRAALLEAAATVFNTDGYFQTDSNALARAAGYAPGTFYKHFTDKRDLFLAAYREWVVTEWADIRRLAGERADVDALVRDVVASVVAHHARWHGFRASLRALVAIDPVVREYHLELRRAQLAWLDSLSRDREYAPQPRERSLALLVTFERLCDMLAVGEATELGVSDNAVRAELQSLLRSYLTGA